MSSGFYFPHTARGSHQALPVKDSCRSEETGQPARVTDQSGFPLIAECQACRGRIRLSSLLQMEWQHAPGAPGPALAGGDSA